MTDATNDEARVAEIREFHTSCHQFGVDCYVCWLLDQRDRYKAAVDAVLGLHVPWRPTHPKNIAYSDLCSTCRGEHGAYRSWPCPTVKAINDALGGTS